MCYIYWLVNTTADEWPHQDDQFTHSIDIFLLSGLTEYSCLLAFLMDLILFNRCFLPIPYTLLKGYALQLSQVFTAPLSTCQQEQEQEHVDILVVYLYQCIMYLKSHVFEVQVFSCWDPFQIPKMIICQIFKCPVPNVYNEWRVNGVGSYITCINSFRFGVIWCWLQDMKSGGFVLSKQRLFHITKLCFRIFFSSNL